MKRIAIASILILCLFGVANGKQGDTNFTKVYKSSKEDVVFNHKSHSKTINNCGTCHDAFDSYGKVDREYAHTVCKSCHNGGKNLPVKCADCHVK